MSLVSNLLQDSDGRSEEPSGQRLPGAGADAEDQAGAAV